MATTKICGKCDTPKEENDFNWENKSEGKRHDWCRECTKIAKKISYRKHRDSHLALVRERKTRNKSIAQQKVMDYLDSHHCLDCGESDPIVLHFDHRGNKYRDISHMICNGYDWDKIEKEITKCDVRCANCHLRKTAKEQNHWKTSFAPVVKSDMAQLS